MRAVPPFVERGGGADAGDGRQVREPPARAAARRVVSRHERLADPVSDLPELFESVRLGLGCGDDGVGDGVEDGSEGGLVGEVGGFLIDCPRPQRRLGNLWAWAGRTRLRGLTS